MIYKVHKLLGKITKVYGFDGTVTVKLEQNFTGNIPELKSVFLEIEGKPVPFIISESYRPGRDIIRLKFDGYDRFEKVSEFTGCRIFLTSDDKVAKSDKDSDDLRGFKILRADTSFLGTVAEIMENPGQWLLNVITTKGEKILIPLHEDLILGIDKKKKIIRMELPEGLIDLNQ